MTRFASLLLEYLPPWKQSPSPSEEDFQWQDTGWGVVQTSLSFLEQICKVSATVWRQQGFIFFVKHQEILWDLIKTYVKNSAFQTGGSNLHIQFF